MIFRLGMFAVCIVLGGCFTADGDSGNAGAGDDAAVEAFCSAQQRYFDDCMVDTDGANYESCRVLTGNGYFRSDVLLGLAQCHDARRMDCSERSCTEEVIGNLGLAVDDNLDLPIIKACGTRYSTCSGGLSTTVPTGKCGPLLWYTKAGQGAAAHCLTDAVSCSETTECIVFPDSY